MFRLRTRLLLAYLAVLCPLALAFGAWAFSATRAGFETELGRSLHTVATAVAAGYSGTSTAGRLARLEPDSEATRERLQAAVESVRTETGLQRIRILSPERKSLVDTDVVAPFASYFDLEGDRHEIDAVLRTGTARSSVLFYAPSGEPMMRGYAPIRHEDRIVAVVAVEGTASFFSHLESLRLRFVAFGLFVLGVVVVVTIAMSRRVTAPLSKLSDVARRIGVGDRHCPVPEGGRDEIGELATALREMQRGLRARDEEAQLMLAGIAHEIRNPLSGMELFIGLIDESIDPDSPEAAHTARIRGELAYLDRVVGEFLLFARDRPLSVCRAPANDWLESAIGGLAVASDRGVRVEIDVEPADLTISGDLVALRGVLVNIVQNGVQASPKGGRVVVRADAPSRDRRRITVQDFGTGIDEHAIADVMRPFYTTREKGTGLGLPLAKKIVERHGGTIALASRLGEGTTVRVELPFDSLAPAVESMADVGAAPPRDCAGLDGEMIG